MEDNAVKTIPEAQSAKRKLEGEIDELLTRFQSKYGLRVTAIQIHRGIPEDGSDYILGITVDAKI